MPRKVAPPANEFDALAAEFEAEAREAERFARSPYVRRARELRPPPGPGEPPLDDLVAAMRWKSSSERLQRLIDGALESRGLKYENAWFSWELLRRSPLWPGYAWWTRTGKGGSPSQKALRRSLRRSLDAFTEWTHRPDLVDVFPSVGDYVYGLGTNGNVPPDVGRCFGFPEPAPDGTCPEAARAHSAVLWALLAPYSRVPLVILSKRSLVGKAPQRKLTHGVLPVLLDLTADDDAILRAVSALRENQQVAVPGYPQQREFGRQAYPPVRAIRLLEHVEAGGGLPSWVKDVEQAEVGAGPAKRPRDGTAADATETITPQIGASRTPAREAKRLARRTLQRLLDLIEKDPLRTLRPSPPTR